jgi:hypothetical protein
MYNEEILVTLTIKELRILAEEYGCKGKYKTLKKEELISFVLQCMNSVGYKELNDKLLNLNIRKKREYMRLGGKKHGKFLSRLKQTHPELIKSLNAYTGTYYKKVNSALRAGRKLVPSVKKIVDDIDSIFEMVKPTTREITVYRGVNSENDLLSHSFISTSYDPMVSYGYVNGICCLMVITIPVGSKVLFLESVSKHRGENEILLSRKAKLKLTNVVQAPKVKRLNMNIKNEMERTEDLMLQDLTQYFVKYKPQRV